ncbi:OsmC family protein [Gemella cuniculi]|uniref:OsmC family protein n=1 Tax=Gemella cuniculi TaxID=150240 RepID=UPI000404E59C|nr:OsmC family protein [Gemella cuniculi]
MYKVTGTINKGYTVHATTSLGGNYDMFMDESKDGPVNLFSVAYVGCMTMCAKGYFHRAYGLEDLEVKTDLVVDYENRKIVADIYVDRTENELANGDRQGVLDNIKLRCKVSHMLSSDLDITYNVHAKK